jgi:hypothetical protein
VPRGGWRSGALRADTQRIDENCVECLRLVLSVCVFVRRRRNLEVILATCDSSGCSVSDRINCYLIHYMEVAENVEFSYFDGVSASSTTSALKSITYLNLVIAIKICPRLAANCSICKNLAQSVSKER